MYDVPSDPTIVKVTITAESVKEGKQPEILRDELRTARPVPGSGAKRN
jgi:ATP-dependent Clp protease ATP-binding subunit ClpX